MHATPPSNDAAARSNLRLTMRWRFNPQVLVLVVGLVVAWPAIVGVVVSGIHVLWSASFRQVDYTMDEARANDGAPYITGRLGTNGETYLVAARRSGDGYLVGREGDDTFAPGKTIKLWFSEKAPDIVIAGQRTNAVPVSTLPERPGIMALAGYLAWLVVVAWIAARVMRWAIGKRSAGVVTQTL
jgi:hypothetical protein